MHVVALELHLESSAPCIADCPWQDDYKASASEPKESRGAECLWIDELTSALSLAIVSAIGQVWEEEVLELQLTCEMMFVALAGGQPRTSSGVEDAAALGRVSRAWWRCCVQGAGE